MTLAARPLPPQRSLPAAVAHGRTVAGPNATLVARSPVGQSAGLFTFDLDAPLTNYRAGQYVALGIRRESGLIARPYSIVSLTRGASRIELLIRRVDGGALSPRLFELSEGARVNVGPPRGLFVLEPHDFRMHLLVGAGTGIAPLLAMAAALVTRPAPPPVTVIHGVSYPDELVYRDRIDAWRAAGLPIDYRPTVSRPADPRCAGWAGSCGRAEAELEQVAATGLDPERAVAYVCGNHPMVGASVAVLAYAGLPDEAIRIERF